MQIITITSPLGPLSTVAAPSLGIMAIEAPADFGVDGSGKPYYNSDAVTKGEEAVLGFDRKGNLCIMKGFAT